MNSKSDTIDTEITYGIDKGSPDGDMTALTIKRGKKLFTFVGEEAEAVQALLLRERKKGRDELKEAVAKHLEKIEKQEGGGMLDIYAITGAIKHDEEAAFARDRLVSERRAVSLIFSIAAELSRLSGEESHE